VPLLATDYEQTKVEFWKLRDRGEPLASATVAEAAKP
jgi:hypothetical protein